jgi:hypothetical protein
MRGWLGICVSEVSPAYNHESIADRLQLTKRDGRTRGK